MIVIITIITTEIGDCKNRRDTELVTFMVGIVEVNNVKIVNLNG